VSVRRATHKTPSRVARKGSQVLLTELRELISKTREQTAQAVNAGLTLLYWQVGDRIRREILKEKRAEYGAEILQALSAKLTMEFGRGFSQRNLASMVRFAEVFPDQRIVLSLIRQLIWTHIIALLPHISPSSRRASFSNSASTKPSYAPAPVASMPRRLLNGNRSEG
jgi:hypothetical protein